MLGLGILSKYAMLYFLIGLGLAAVIDPVMRAALVSLRGGVAMAVMLMVIAPHFAWNAANDFQTVGHTVDNANLGGELFHPENALKFIADQMGVFGPVSFLAFLAGLAGWRSRTEGVQTRWLLCFVLPVLVFILGQAILSRAHANWAATAYPGAALLVAAWFAQRRAVLWTALAVNALIALVFLVVPQLSPAQTAALGMDNALKRTRGWDEAAEQVFAEAERLGATAVLVDEREVWHGLDFYARERAIPLISWRRYAGPKSFSEREPLEGAAAERVLVVSLHPAMRPKLRSDFSVFEPAGQIRIPLGTRSNGCTIYRIFQLYTASGYTPSPRSWNGKNGSRVRRNSPSHPARPPVRAGSGVLVHFAPEGFQPGIAATGFAGLFVFRGVARCGVLARGVCGPEGGGGEDFGGDRLAEHPAGIGEDRLGGIAFALAGDEDGGAVGFALIAELAARIGGVDMADIIFGEVRI